MSNSLFDKDIRSLSDDELEVFQSIVYNEQGKRMREKTYPVMTDSEKATAGRFTIDTIKVYRDRTKLPLRVCKYVIDTFLERPTV